MDRVTEKDGVTGDWLTVLTEEQMLKLARNPNMSPEILDVLSKADSFIVRMEVAGNPNTAPKTLKTLAKDDAWIVRWFVLGNHNTPLETIKELTEDEVSVVREAAKKRLKELLRH
ncbi:MAG: hypothetical protein RXP92_03650 [Candidatus Micrarchaeota archaeon]